MHSDNTIIKNTLALGIVQLANYAIPIIQIPYLVRVLTPSGYGRIAFAYAFIQYFITFVDYGFNVSATRAISVNRNKKNEINKIFSSILIIKILLSLTSLLILCVLMLFIDKFKDVVFLLTFTSVVGNVIFPIWLYQGLEHMKIIAVANGLFKMAGAILIFLLVKSPTDIYNAVILQNAAVVVSGACCFIYAIRAFSIKLVYPGIDYIRETLSKAWAVFISIISVAIMGNSTVFILGLFKTNDEVGYYAVAQKIVWSIVNLTNPIATAAFPRVGYLLKNKIDEAKNVLKRLLLWESVIFGTLSVLLFLLAKELTLIFTGVVNDKAILYVQIMAFMPLMISIDNIFGMQIMLNTGLDKQFMKIYIVACLISLLTGIIMVPRLGGVASAMSLTLSEIFILVMVLKYSTRSNIKLFNI